MRFLRSKSYIYKYFRHALKGKKYKLLKYHNFVNNEYLFMYLYFALFDYNGSLQTHWSTNHAVNTDTHALYYTNNGQKEY